jgi:hypothetical protein
VDYCAAIRTGERRPWRRIVTVSAIARCSCSRSGREVGIASPAATFISTSNWSSSCRLGEAVADLTDPEPRHVALGARIGRSDRHRPLAGTTLADRIAPHNPPTPPSAVRLQAWATRRNHSSMQRSTISWSMSTRWWACRMPMTVGQLDIAAVAVAGEPLAPGQLRGRDDAAEGPRCRRSGNRRATSPPRGKAHANGKGYAELAARNAALAMERRRPHRRSMAPSPSRSPTLRCDRSRCSPALGPAPGHRELSTPKGGSRKCFRLAPKLAR